MKNKKKLLLVLLAIIAIVVVTVGVTLAFFSYTKEGSKENTITVGAITFHYNEDSLQGIQLLDALPMGDNDGKSQNKYFDFTITSNNNVETTIPYQITSRKVSNSSVELDEQYVKMYLTKLTTTNNTTTEDPTPLLYNTYNNLPTVQYNNHEEEILWTDIVPANTANYTQKYRLRMWLADTLDFSPEKNQDGTYKEVNGEYVYPNNNKQFSIKLNVYAGDAKQEPVEQLSSLSLNTGTVSEVLDSSLGYDYVTSPLPIGTTSATLNVTIANENDTVTVEKLNGLAINNDTSNIRRLSTTKVVQLENLVEGDNYYRITIASSQNISSSYIIKVVVVGNYKETLLNGAYPVLTSNLVPVTIDNNGVVYKADLTTEWYSYEDKQWANAVVLKSSTEYAVDDQIPETDIESYFVWIPKYSYKIWDLGNYNGLTGVDNSKGHPIDITFGTVDTVDSTTECATPLVAGTTGTCSVGKYMTHPAFISMGTNGIWVGKFETGYDGALSSFSAQRNEVDTSKIVIKPNIYSWRGITLGNSFLNSIQYMGSEDSHLMKNIEWGAVAYLSNSVYGLCTGNSCNELRINNHGSYITGYASKYDTSSASYNIESNAQFVNGTYSYYYFDVNSNNASTTQNYTGIYDMSGGGQEYISAYHNSGIGTSADKTGFTITNYNSKYYDRYTTTNGTNYSNRILGDATGELGPFAATNDSRQKSSWYDDYAFTISSDFPAIGRGGYCSDAYIAGLMAFDHNYGNDKEGRTFRIVLAPVND